MKHVVITGVSTGIGHDAALKLAGRGYHVFGSVRKLADAESLQRALGDRFTPLVFDVTDASAVADAAGQIRTTVGTAGLAGLVNNAGISINAPLMHMPVQDLQRLFDVNVAGVHRVTQALLPLLGASKPCPHPPGRIINISSVAGRLAYPFFAAYAASKHALEAYSDGLRRELALYEIPVVVIEPGLINTPIWDKSDGLMAYLGTDYAPYIQALQKWVGERRSRGLPPDAVSRVICNALECRAPRTRYVVLTYGIRGLIRQWWIPRLMPDAWIDRQFKKQWGLAR